MLNKTALEELTKAELVDLTLDHQKRLTIARNIYLQTRNTLDQIEIIMTDNNITKIGPKYIKARRFLVKLRSFVPSAKPKSLVPATK